MWPRRLRCSSGGHQPPGVLAPHPGVGGGSWPQGRPGTGREGLPPPRVPATYEVTWLLAGVCRGVAERQHRCLKDWQGYRAVRDSSGTRRGQSCQVVSWLCSSSPAPDPSAPSLPCRAPARCARARLTGLSPAGAGVFFLSSAEGEQISFLFDCIVRGISPTKGPFGLRPVLPGAWGSMAWREGRWASALLPMPP